MTRRPRRPPPRPVPRSFTIREHSAVDGLARSDTRQARAASKELSPQAVPASVRFAPRKDDVPRKRDGLGRETAIMAGGTLLSRITGLLRILVAGYALGFSHLSDAFNLANNTPNIVHDLVLGGILSATFVPLFVDRLAKRSEEEATEAISAVVSLAVVILVVATVLFVIAAPLFIDLYTAGTHNPGIGTERTVATELLRMFALQLLGYGAISLMTALLNTRRRFSLPAYVPVLNNLIAISILIEFHLADRHPSDIGVAHNTGLLLLLGLGTTAGVLVQAAALVPSTLGSGLRLRFRWAPRHEAVREVVSLSGWTLGFVLTNQIALFVTLAVAVHIDPSGGAVTAYTYAFTFFQLPFGVVAVSVMSAVTPEMAHRWSTGDLEAMAHQFGLGFRRMMAGVLPATIGYLVLAGPLMALLFGYGAAAHGVMAHPHPVGASNPGAALTASLLALLAVGLPGYCTYLLAIRALQAMRDTRTAFFLYLLENGLNILLLFLLIGVIKTQALALSLSLAYSASAVVALTVVRRRMGSLGGRSVGRYVLRALALSLAMGLAVALAAAGIGGDSGIGLFERVVVSVIVGVAVFGGGASLAAVASGWQTSGRRQQAAGKRA
ncbi:MAG: murein biosynthesis integral membrane protein MurJ [Acidimicrobiales bacterium]